MAVYPTLREHLAEWPGTDARKSAVTDTVVQLAHAGAAIARLMAKGPLRGGMTERRGAEEGGEPQKTAGFVIHEIVTNALKQSPAAWMVSDEAKDAVALNAGAPLAVNVHPLDGSSEIDVNLPAGTIFSILPADGPSPPLQPGRNQLAAGYILYGQRTALVLTLGQGTHVFWLVPDTGEFVLARQNVQIPRVTREYAINSSNFRFWEDAIKAYIIDCKLGAEGPRKANFSMHWLASLLAEAFRILTRGGIYLYPGDLRQGYANGHLRLLHEANPIAMLTEQAGGACTTGTGRMLDIEPASLHQRVPLVFGSKTEVEEVAHYYREPHSLGARSPLFAQRGLFRSVGS